VGSRRQEKKPRFDNSQSVTARERELLALFRVMTEPDRRLLLSTAETLVSPVISPMDDESSSNK
jgi:hypothetical protein